MEWMNYTPEFECDNYNRDMLKYSPWSGHRLFAYDLIANTRPETVVELGSFYGCSMFTFAQAVKDQHLNTSLNAVDYGKYVISLQRRIIKRMCIVPFDL